MINSKNLTKLLLLTILALSATAQIFAAEQAPKQQPPTPLTKQQKKNIEKAFGKNKAKAAKDYIHLIDTSKAVDSNSFAEFLVRLPANLACIYAAAVINPSAENYDTLLKYGADFFDIALLAMQQGHMHIFKKIAKKAGPDITKLRDRVYQISLLHEAMLLNNPETAELVLKIFRHHKVDPNTLTDSRGMTPLHFATHAGNSTAIQMLIDDSQAPLPAKPVKLSRETFAMLSKTLGNEKAGAYVKALSNPTDENLDKLFAEYEHNKCIDIATVALEHHHIPILRWVTKKDNDLLDLAMSFKQDLGCDKISAYMKTVHSPTQALSRELLQDLSKNQRVAITKLAAKLNHPNVLEEIGKFCGPEYLVQPYSGTNYSALMDAATHNSSACIKVILDAKGDCNMRGVGQDTALHALEGCAQEDCSTTAQLLIEAQADIHACNDEKMTALQTLLIARSNKRVVELLLKNKANPNVHSPGPRGTALTLVPMQESGYTQEEACELIKLLAYHNADPNAPNQSGFFPLDHAFGRPKIFATLLAMKSDPNLGCDNFPQICDAADNGNETMLDILLQDGRTNLDATTHEGNSALILATNHNYLQIAKRLLEAKASVDKPVTGGCTALMNSVWLNNTPLFELLLEAKADPEKKSDLGYTILHVAAMKQAQAMVDHILKLKLVNPSIKDHYGRTYQDILRDNARAQTALDIEQGLIARPALPSKRSVQKVMALESKEDDAERAEDSGSESEEEVPLTATQSMVIKKKHIFGTPVFNPQTGELSGGHFSKTKPDVGDVIKLSQHAQLTVKDVQSKPHYAGFYQVVYGYQDDADKENRIAVDHKKTYFAPFLTKKEIIALAVKTVQQPEAQERTKAGKKPQDSYYSTFHGGLGNAPVILRARVTTDKKSKTLDTFYPMLDESQVARIALLKESAGNNPQ